METLQKRFERGSDTLCLVKQMGLRSLNRTSTFPWYKRYTEGMWP